MERASRERDGALGVEPREEPLRSLARQSLDEETLRRPEAAARSDAHGSLAERLLDASLVGVPEDEALSSP